MSICKFQEKIPSEGEDEILLLLWGEEPRKDGGERRILNGVLKRIKRDEKTRLYAIQPGLVYSISAYGEYILQYDVHVRFVIEPDICLDVTHSIAMTDGTTSLLLEVLRHICL